MCLERGLWLKNASSIAWFENDKIMETIASSRMQQINYWYMEWYVTVIRVCTYRFICDILERSCLYVCMFDNLRHNLCLVPLVWPNRLVPEGHVTTNTIENFHRKSCKEFVWWHEITYKGEICFPNPIDIITTVEECLIHWGQMTHIPVSKLSIIIQDKGLSPTFIWTNAGILLIRP